MLDDDALPTFECETMAASGRLYVVDRCPYVLTFEHFANAPNSHILYSPIFGPSQTDVIKKAVAHASNQPRKFKLLRVRPPNYTGDDLNIDEIDVPSRLDWFVDSDESMMLRTEIDHWLGGMSWYHERNLAWRLGVMLYGPPGTGKTSLVRKLAQEFKVPVFVVDAEGLSKIRDWSQFWSAGTAHAQPPVFILIEDFDLALRSGELDDEKPVNTNHTLSSLMNIMDGISTPDGVVFFVTTNNPDDVEDAAVRPGRIDLRINLGPLPATGRSKLATRILRGLDDDSIAAVVKAGDGETGAAFRERCRRIAVETYLTGDHHAPRTP